MSNTKTAFSDITIQNAVIDAVYNFIKTTWDFKKL